MDATDSPWTETSPSTHDRAGRFAYLRGLAMVAEEERSITEFVEIWYSDRTRDNLAKIVIRNDS